MAETPDLTIRLRIDATQAMEQLAAIRREIEALPAWIGGSSEAEIEGGA